MKKTSRILALVVVALMVMMMAVPAMADTETAKNSGDFSVTITNTDQNTAHSYAAYQVFKGDLVEKSGATDTTQGKDGEKLILSNIEWGNGVNGIALLTALQTASTTTGHALYGLFPVASVTSAAAVADVLAGSAFTNDDAKAQAFAEIVQNNLNTSNKHTGNGTGVTGLNAGYYFIQDEGNLSGDTAHAGAKTRYILQVVHDVKISQKASVPQVDKKTKDKNDTTGDVTGWQNTADYDVGDSVPFQITGTLPSTFADFDHYTTYTITDTLSAGLTPPAATGITIMVGATDVTDLFDIGVSGQTITISLKSGQDLKTWTSPALTSASEFVVTYNAVLNNNAVKGNQGNTNSATLTFSNNPNSDGTGDYDTTPPDTAVVFTYDLVVGKTDSSGTALDGANFALYKKYATLPAGATEVTTTTYDEGRKTYTFSGEHWVKVSEITTGSTFNFAGIDDGDYVLIETVTPNGYNSVDPYPFTVTTVLDNTGKTITTINGVASGIVALGTLTATVTIDDDESSLATTVVNNSGATLPSTGGIGTTIFYIGGSILVLLAVVLLVTRRRMTGNN